MYRKLTLTAALALAACTQPGNWYVTQPDNTVNAADTGLTLQQCQQRASRTTGATCSEDEG